MLLKYYKNGIGFQFPCSAHLQIEILTERGLRNNETKGEMYSRVGRIIFTSSPSRDKFFIRVNIIISKLKTFSARNLLVVIWDDQSISVDKRKMYNLWGRP